MEVDEWDEKIKDSLRYKIRLLIRHPNLDPDRITSTLGLTPHLSAIAGSVRKNPVGMITSGSAHRYCLEPFVAGRKKSSIFFGCGEDD